MIAQKQTYSNLTIHLDGSTFVGCHFVNCVLVYSATLPVHMNGCSFEGGRFEFGGAAANTVSFMTGFYQGGGQCKALIEQTFEGIRQGQTKSRRVSDTSVTS